MFAAAKQTMNGAFQPYEPKVDELQPHIIEIA